MGSYTTKLNLYKPDVGETGWGALVNTNFDTIDTIEPADIGAEPAITKKTAFNKDFGTAAGTVCEGNDARLSDTRTPTAHASTHASGGTDAITIAQSQVTNLSTTLNGKVNVAQGTANAGKYLAVGADGNVTLKEVIPGKVYGFKIPYGSKTDNIEYTDSAVGMNETQRRALVRSWAKHAVVQNGVVKYWLDETNLNKKANGTASVLTGADGDVMLMYKPIFWKVSHVDNQYTLVQFSDYNWDVGNTVTAHRYGDGICSYLGLGVFEGIIQSSALRSINSSGNPTVNTTNNAFYNAAIYGRNGGHYNQMLPLTWTLYAILLLFEGGNRNVQAKWGNGVISKSWDGSFNGNAVNEGWNATTPWNRNNNSNTSGVTAGGIHNMWGNIYKFFGEFIKETTNVARFTIRGGSDHSLISATTMPNSWASIQMTGVTGACFMDCIGDKHMPFLPRTTGSGSSNTYWPDNCWSSTSQRNCGLVGGNWGDGVTAGLFLVSVSDAVSSTNVYFGARLQVLIE